MCQGYWKHKLSRLRDCDSNCRCCNYVRLQCNFFLMSLPVSLCSLQILKWQRKVSSGSSQSQATGHHFSVACILCNRTRMKVTHLSIPTSPKPRMWVLALTKIHLQAGSVWFWNQVAQMSCIVVQQTQHHWNQHHHLCVLVWVAHCKSVPVLQDWPICLQNNEISVLSEWASYCSHPLSVNCLVFTKW